MTKEPISPNEAKEISEKIVPAYFEALNEELVKHYTGTTICVYDAEILSRMTKLLNLTYSTIYIRLPYRMLDSVKEEYEKLGWLVTRPEKYKCNEDPHYIFKEA